jgi:hypothetical protein
VRRLVPLLLGTAGLGFLGVLLAARKLRGGKVIASETPAQVAPSSYAPASVPAAPVARAPALAPPSPPPPPRSSEGYVPAVAIPPELSPAIVASARKWAKARGLPVGEVLATILVESSGKVRAWNCQPGPRPDGCTKENSRGLMQVNINAWMSLLKANGMAVEDLYDVDKNIMIGTYIYAKYRAEVQSLIAQSGVRQKLPLGTITRLYYKGPKYVRDAILAGRVLGTTPADRPYKQTAEAVANWNNAMAKVSSVA